MAISFGDNQGALFNCIGRLGKVISELRSYQNSQDTNMTSQTAGVVGQYNANPDIQAIMGSNYIGILNAAGGNVGGTVQQMARQTVNRFVFNDSPRLNQTLTSDNTLASMQEIIRQMKSAGATVLACTVAGTPQPFQGVGNGTLNVSLKRPQDGASLENAFAETMNAICSQDSYTGNALPGNETFNVTGTGGLGDPFAFDWPLGSNSQAQIQMINGGANETQGNLLNNSSFEDWTDDVPDNWSVVAGTPGTDIVEASGAGYDGSASLLFTGFGGGAMPGVKQQFNASPGNTTELASVTQYGACVFLRRGGTAAGQGTLRMALVDVNGTVILDEAGTPCQLDVDLTAVTVDWQFYTVAFRTPLVMPSQIYFYLKVVGSEPDAGFQLYADRISMGEMTQIYTGGPYVCGHSGNVNFVVNDLSQIVVTNSRGAGGSLDTFQTLFFRLITEMGQNELLLPSSATPSISDLLITRD